MGCQAVLADPESLRQGLLLWWLDHGRRGIPWKVNPDGAAPAPGDCLDPYAIWVAEVM